MIRKIPTFLLASVALVLALHPPCLGQGEQEERDRTLLDFGSCEVRVISSSLHDSLGDGGTKIEPHEGAYRLAVVRLGVRSSDPGLLALSPDGFSIVFERDGFPRSVVSRALGIIGTDETGVRKQHWIERGRRAISTLRYRLKEGVEKIFQLVFDLPRDVEEFVLNVPSALPDPVSVKGD